MKSKNLARQVLGATLTIVSLMSWNIPSIRPSGFAATNPGVTRLTNQPASSAFTNGKIAFVSTHGTKFEIHTMNADGSDRVPLTSGPNDFEPAWSPDGTQIAFVRNEGSANGGEIFVMNQDGSNQRQLTQSAFGNSPAWSPDGTKLAFSNGCLGCASSVVYVVNADGTDQRIISRGVSEPVWSPDGSKLAVTSNNFTIGLINADGGGRTELTAPPAREAEDTDPSWSPDGSKIAFTRWTGCDFNDCYNPEIWTVNADGSNPASPAGVYGYGLNWSPDGMIFILSNDQDLFVMNADGSGVTNITNTKDVSEFDPSWQPLLVSCADSISPTEQSFEAAGGTGSVDVTGSPDCSWTAISYSGWVAVASVSSSGNGRAVYSVAANSSTGSRTAVLIIAGRKINITQSGVPIRIASASVSGKRLLVLGQNFDPGAVILLNGEAQKTISDEQNSKTTLIAKKAGKRVNAGDKLQVRNPNGSMSQEFTFTGS